jgi:hypothetical protein
VPNFDPEPSVWADGDRVRIMVVEAGDGASASLSPREARLLAKKLIAAARSLEKAAAKSRAG